VITTRQEHFDVAAFGAVVTDLCRIGPRFVGTPGERAAGMLIEREFRAAGLAAVRVEPVPVLAYRPQAAACHIVGQPDALPCSGLQFTSGGEVEAEAVYNATIDPDSGAAHGDLRGIDGKIAVIATPYPYVAAPLLCERGAAGIVVVGDAPDGLVSHFSAQLYPPSEAPDFPGVPLPAPGVTIEAGAGAALIHRLHSQRTRLRIEHRAAYEPTLSGNVLGEIPGQTEERVVLGAHYDTQWDTPGACDNASGVAALITFARRHATLRPLRTIVLAAFADEEHGCYGSTVYCQQHAASLADTVAMVNLDALGWSPQAKRALWADASIRAFCRDAAQTLGWPPQEEREPSEFSGSDYNPFLDAGVPAAFFWRYPPGNPYYHSAGDSLAHVDIAVMAETATVAAQVGLRLANEPTSFGRARPRRRWKSFPPPMASATPKTRSEETA
jgi:Peptidase family M28